MGDIIDNIKAASNGTPYSGYRNIINNAPPAEAISKADYNARLKADMVAMLEDLDLQIDESAAYNLEVAKVQRLIRDRIDKLKEGKNTHELS